MPLACQLSSELPSSPEDTTLLLYPFRPIYIACSSCPHPLTHPEAFLLFIGLTPHNCWGFLGITCWKLLLSTPRLVAPPKCFQSSLFTFPSRLSLCLAALQWPSLSSALPCLRHLLKGRDQILFIFISLQPSTGPQACQAVNKHLPNKQI